MKYCNRAHPNRNEANFCASCKFSFISSPPAVPPSRDPANIDVNSILLQRIESALANVERRIHKLANAIKSLPIDDMRMEEEDCRISLNGMQSEIAAKGLYYRYMPTLFALFDKLERVDRAINDRQHEENNFLITFSDFEAEANALEIGARRGFATLVLEDRIARCERYSMKMKEYFQQGNDIMPYRDKITALNTIVQTIKSEIEDKKLPLSAHAREAFVNVCSFLVDVLRRTRLW